jgi:hypothetical protein
VLTAAHQASRLASCRALYRWRGAAARAAAEATARAAAAATRAAAEAAARAKARAEAVQREEAAAREAERVAEKEEREAEARRAARMVAERMAAEGEERLAKERERAAKEQEMVAREAERAAAAEVERVTRDAVGAQQTAELAAAVELAATERERAAREQERAERAGERAEEAVQQAAQAMQRAEHAERDAAAEREAHAGQLGAARSKRDTAVQRAEEAVTRAGQVEGLAAAERTAHAERLDKLTARLEYTQSALTSEAGRCMRLVGIVQVQRQTLARETEEMERIIRRRCAELAALAVEIDVTAAAGVAAGEDARGARQRAVEAEERESSARAEAAAAREERHAAEACVEKLRAELLLSAAAAAEARARAEGVETQLEHASASLREAEDERDAVATRAGELESFLRRVGQEVEVAAESAAERETTLGRRASELAGALERETSVRGELELALRVEEGRGREAAVASCVLHRSLDEALKGEQMWRVGCEQARRRCEQASGVASLYRSCVGDCDEELAKAVRHAAERDAAIAGLEDRLRSIGTAAAEQAVGAAETRRALLDTLKRCRRAEASAAAAHAQLLATDALARGARHEAEALRARLVIDAQEYDSLAEAEAGERRAMQAALLEMQQTLEEEARLRSRAQEGAVAGRERERVLETELSRVQHQFRECVEDLNAVQAAASRTASEFDEQRHALHLEMQASLMHRAELDTRLAEEQAAYTAAVRELQSSLADQADVHARLVAEQTELRRRLQNQAAEAAARQLRHVVRSGWSSHAAVAFHCWRANAVGLGCDEQARLAADRLVQMDQRARMHMLQQARTFEMKLQELAGEAAEFRLLPPPRG